MNGFYWIYLAMLGFLLGYHFCKTEEKRRLIYYGACGFLILLFTLQDYSVSIDIPEYMNQYAIIPTLSLREMLVHKFEIGYVLLCRFVAFTFESERILLLALSVLILIPFSWAYERDTSQPMIALMAFLALGMYMHALIFWRQLVAMAILTFAYPYLQTRKFRKLLLVVLAAMTFHKTAIVFLGLYFIYPIPINKWLLLFCSILAAALGFFGDAIIEFGIRLIYPRYTEFPRLAMGGGTLLALLWVITLLSFWLFQDRFEESKIRIPFLMVLTAATIQPICFAFYNWLRIVLYFRIGLVAMTAQLYAELFENTDNKLMKLLNRLSPALHARVLHLYSKPWFPVVMQLILFAVLFIWYDSELEGARYLMAPVC